MSEGGFPAGVRPIEHTADIGMEVGAVTLEALFDRAAAGMMAFLSGADVDGSGGRGVGAAAPAGDAGRAFPSAQAEPADRSVERELDLEATDTANLLVDWLREILLVCEAEDLCYSGARFDRPGERTLHARVRFGPREGAPVREIKGVTYHGLEVTRRGEGWYARVVFDV